MRWDFVVTEWMDRLNTDPELKSRLKGGKIEQGQSSRPVTVPSGEWSLTGERETELFVVINFQIDVWAKGAREVGLIHKRIYDLSHNDVGQELGGERGWLRYIESAMIEYPADRYVAHGRQNFEAEVIRRKYTTV